jgi:hypothetical protein
VYSNRLPAMPSTKLSRRLSVCRFTVRFRDDVLAPLTKGH